MKKITITEIPQDGLEGYYWLSNAEKPEVLERERGDKFEPPTKNNPFIAEALLYDREKNISYHILHAGEYSVFRYDLDNLPPGAKLCEVEYLPHRLGEVKKVCFKQLWVPEADSLCEGMEVLNMKALIFTGFKK